MKLRKRVAVGLAAIVLAGGAGLVAFRQSGLSYPEVRRNVRSALGLPKFWVKTFNDDPAGYAEMACPAKPLVIVTGGQSNAANAYDDVVPSAGNPNTAMFFAGRCYRLRSPVLGSTGTKDSLWPALGDALNRGTGRPVLFVNGAVGGVQIGDWLDDRSKYLERLAAQVNGARKRGYRPDFVLWIQGETDSSTFIDPARYVGQQRDLIAKLDATGATDAGTPWVVYRSTRCLKRGNNGPAIDRAVAALTAKPGDRLVPGPNVSAYDDSFRRDLCHMNRKGRDRLVGDTIASLQAARLIAPAAPPTASR